MHLKGTGVRIVVRTPDKWVGKNLFGTIIFERGGNRIIVELSNKVSGAYFETNLIEFSPSEKNNTFRPLAQYYAVEVNGNLIDKDSGLREPFISAVIVFD